MHFPWALFRVCSRLDIRVANCATPNHPIGHTTVNAVSIFGYESLHHGLNPDRSPLSTTYAPATTRHTYARSMGQSSSHSAQDVIKESISGPKQLAPPGTSGQQSARSARPRSGSVDTNRLRRDRRRSRDQTGLSSPPSSPIAPTVGSPSMTALITSSISETAQTRTRTQSPQPSQRIHPRRRSSTATTATAPPPYTSEPAGLDVQLAEAPPPPVPPRDRPGSAGADRRFSARMEKSPMDHFREPAGRHRRTMSHSSLGLSGPSAMRASSPPSAMRRQMPPLVSTPPVSGMGVGGFRAEMGEAPRNPQVEFSTAGGTPGVYSPQFDRESRPQPRTRRSGDHTSPRAPPSRRGSREDPLEMLR
jgi:hypothetical protein